MGRQRASKKASVLTELTRKNQPNKVQWSEECERAFQDLKDTLCQEPSAPALGLPNYALPFHLWVSESGGTAAAVLAQPHGGGLRPCAYYSETLDVTARGLPSCLRAVAACALMVQDAEKIDLIRATFLPSRLAVVKVRSHQRSSDPDSVGNNYCRLCRETRSSSWPPLPFYEFGFLLLCCTHS
uniref:Reverse transcriptase/retrotransposon-derived protein RNase H-like domain-containing protein n=1 Tax=Pygocentrus nattereri TaxID=42514 RepID=A0AAR2IIK3_PYGNA